MAIDTGDKVTRKYANFRGVDFRGEECSLNRSPDALNVWRNYKKLASIETRPGLERVLQNDSGVSNIKKYGNMLYYISGGTVYAKNFKNQWEGRYYYIGANGVLFDFEGQLYAKGTGSYAILPNNQTDNAKPIIETGNDTAPFIPTTTIKKTPSGGGETYQDVNMLSPYRINTFRGDGESNVLHLDAQNINDNFIPIITIGGTIKNGGETEMYRRYTHRHGLRDKDGTFMYDTNGELAKETIGMTITGDILNNREDVTRIVVNHQKGTIEIQWAEGAENPFLRKPLTDGQDNIAVVYKKQNDAALAKIMKCTIAQEFDNRLFLSGNPDYPSTVWHSSLNDPSYFSDLDYYEDGVDSSPIRSMVAGNNGLWVFRDADTTNGVFYHTPTFDPEYGKIYPSSHSSVSLGCEGRAINFNDDVVFFSNKGMERVSTDITTEQFATHKSSLVDRKMITHPKYKDMVLAEWEGYLLVFIGNEVFLADSRAELTNENHYEYEWYYWKLFGDDDSVTCATVQDGVLYIGTTKYIYTLTGKPEDGDEYYGYSPDDDKWGDRMYINSYWTTPKDKLGAPNKLKTTNKKGCVVEAVGDVDVYAKVEDTDFEHIGANNGVVDYFVSRIKRKKFKDIQLKFQSKKKFCLESATLECFVGGYIKR